MLKEYEINSSTLLILPDNEGVKVYDGYEDFVVNISMNRLIDNSCKYFGSSYLGRFFGSSNLIGSNIKVPIVVEESFDIIFFPTNSIKNYKCIWISFNNLCKIEKVSINETLLIFKNGVEVIIPITYRILRNQIVRCVNLKRSLDVRKENLQKSMKCGENNYF